MSEVAGRAFDLLEQVARSKTPLGLMALAEGTGVDKTTASRLLRFLEQRDLVTRDPDTGRFSIGPAFMILAATAMGQSDLLMASRAHFPLIQGTTGETVSVHLRVGLERVCLGGLESDNEIRSAVTSGERRSLHRGASGKVILAYLPPADAARGLELARHDGVELGGLSKDLRDLRGRGGIWGASDRIEWLNAVSVPVWSARGIVGALTVSGPSQRWTHRRMEEFFPKLAYIGKQVSASLGGQLDAQAEFGSTPSNDGQRRPSRVRRAAAPASPVSS